MRSIGVFAVTLACFVSAWAQSPGSLRPSSLSNGLVLYDDFNGPRIDPTKWDDWNATFGMREAVRELSPPYQGQGNNGYLHFFHRAYSWTGNDQDTSYGWLGLQFTNPASVTSTLFSVTVNRLAVGGCQTNSATSTAWAGFVGRYFNYAGSQDGNQDVEAGIVVQRVNTDPGSGLTVLAHVSTGDGTVTQFQNVGVASLGQTSKLFIRWDQPNHQFIFQVNGNTPVAIGYNVSDTAPPSNKLKAFWAAQGTPHCTSKPPGSAMIDANIDNVYVDSF